MLSAGESFALLPLLNRALEDDPKATVFLPTSTLTSIAALAIANLPDRAIHQLLPIERL
ncbi:MAG: hypothetical protein HKP37_02185 [Boseongicola sp.]|nr:hypothetical protein [Boseongicola sp.]